MRALAENPILLLVTRGLIGVLFCIASFLAVRAEQDHDTTTKISEQIVGIKEAVQAAGANRYTSIDAERDRIEQAATIGFLRDDYIKTTNNHEARIQRLEGRR